MGVPQGSILSVTLLGLKINSIVKAISPGVECSLYVDDFLICYRINISTSSRDIFNAVSINSLSGPTLMASNSLLLKQSACTSVDSVNHI